MCGGGDGDGIGVGVEVGEGVAVSVSRGEMVVGVAVSVSRGEMVVGVAVSVGRGGGEVGVGTAVKVAAAAATHGVGGGTVTGGMGIKAQERSNRLRNTKIGSRLFLHFISLTLSCKSVNNEAHSAECLHELYSLQRFSQGGLWDDYSLFHITPRYVPPSTSKLTPVI